MAAGKITIEYHRRPCIAKTNGGDLIKAMFHRWSDVRRKGTMAIIELENGRVYMASPEKITFIDGGDFDEYCFGDE